MKPKRPLISVVIPTYNRSTFLDGAIETALGQTYDNVEVVVVDDGSEERYAEETVACYPDSMKCVVHSENRGLSAARNTGIDYANGKYIAFLDDDDRWHKSKLERQMLAIHDSPAIGLVTCLVTALSPDGDLIHCERNAPSGNLSNSILRGNHIGTPSRVLIRRETLESLGGFDESLPTKQDWDLYIRLCQRWQVASIEEHLCVRTIHESMSSSPTAAGRDNVTVLEKHEAMIRKAGEWTAANAEVHDRVGRAYLQSGQLSSARSHLVKSTRCRPSIKSGAMLALSLTTPKFVEGATALKRRLVTWRRNCSSTFSPDVVPGIDA